MVNGALRQTDGAMRLQQDARRRRGRRMDHEPHERLGDVAARSAFRLRKRTGRAFGVVSTQAFVSFVRFVDQKENGPTGRSLSDLTPA